MKKIYRYVNDLKIAVADVPERTRVVGVGVECPYCNNQKVNLIDNDELIFGCGKSKHEFPPLWLDTSGFQSHLYSELRDAAGEYVNTVMWREVPK